MILITGLVIFTSLFGVLSGIVCTLLMVGYSAFFFSTAHSFVLYTALNLYKLLVIILGTTVTTAFVGHLKKVNMRTVAELKEVNQMLTEDNRMLTQASMRDDLTGLRNRFTLAEQLSMPNQSTEKIKIKRMTR